MTADNNQDTKVISKALRERMQDCQLELVGDSAPQHLHRVGPNDWALPGTDLTLTYCPVNCWFVAYRGGQGLFTAHNLAEPEECLQAALNAEGRA